MVNKADTVTLEDVKRAVSTFSPAKPGVMLVPPSASPDLLKVILRLGYTIMFTERIEEAE